MSEIKTAQDRYEKLSNPVLPDVAFRDCLKSEAAELRAAYEALSGKYHELKARSEIDSRTVEAQAKRIAELEAIDEQQLDVAREFCRQLQIENKQLKAFKIKKFFWMQS